jgi:hypothetical protein
MSNRAIIESNNFGFTIKDDFVSSFIPYDQADTIENPVEVLRLCVDNIDDPDGRCLIGFCRNMNAGMYINGEWYDFEEIYEGFYGSDYV